MADKETYVPQIVKKRIDEILDEDCTNSSGTASKAATDLLERSIKLGREKQFKAAMNFWKNSHAVPESVLQQWFFGVFTIQDTPKKVAKKVAKKTAKKVAKKTTKKKTSKKSTKKTRKKT